MYRDLSTIEPLAFSPDGAARRLGVSQRQIYKLIAAGDLHSFKSGKRRLVSDDELRAYLRRVQATVEVARRPTAKPALKRTAG